MDSVQSFDLDSLISSLKGSPVEYLEFLKVSSLSCGIYHLAQGETDPQQPHEEDEIYYVVNGRAKFKTDAGVRDIAAGSILFVAAKAEHCFVDITEELTLLVFFAAAKN